MAKCVVLDNESREGFDSSHSEFVARFQPADGVELGLVEEMLSAFCRQRRTWAIETRIMDNAIATQPPDQDQLTRLADGFTSIAAQPPLELIHRYETRLHRIFQRALANLILMRSLLSAQCRAEAANQIADLVENAIWLAEKRVHLPRFRVAVIHAERTLQKTLVDGSLPNLSPNRQSILTFMLLLNRARRSGIHRCRWTKPLHEMAARTQRSCCGESGDGS